MDKYLTIILIFMVVGIPIAWISPMTGEMRDPPLYVLFYGSIGGIIFILSMVVTKIKRKDKKLMQNEKDLRNRF